MKMRRLGADGPAVSALGLGCMTLNGVYGAARFHTAGKRNGVRAHIGAEIAVAGLGQRLTPPVWLPHRQAAEPARIALLCESRTGYRNLCQLITQFKMRARNKAEGSATLDLSLDLGPARYRSVFSARCNRTRGV